MYKIIESLCKERGISIARMCKECGITRAALTELKMGRTKKLSGTSLERVADYFGVSIESLYGKTKNAPSVSDEAMSIASAYEQLNNADRDAVLDLIKSLQEKYAPKKKIIPLLGQSMAAGSGEPDYGNTMESYEVPEDSQAEVAFRVHGDSLEPYYMDGDIVLGVRRFPKVGEIAALVVDGEYKIKQVCRDDYGNVYLLALNRKRDDTDQTLWRTEEHSVYCLGTILTTKRIPMP